jgi:hypothetical protein
VPKLVKTNIYVESAILARLRALSKRTMIPMARLIRKAILDVLKEYKG